VRFIACCFLVACAAHVVFLFVDMGEICRSCLVFMVILLVIDGAVATCIGFSQFAVVGCVWFWWFVVGVVFGCGGGVFCVYVGWGGVGLWSVVMTVLRDIWPALSQPEAFQCR